MLVSQFEQTATVAWSPASSAPLIASGSVAGALDTSFSTESLLTIRDALKPKDGPWGKVAVAARFVRLAWGASKDKSLGLLAGGLENGDFAIWDPRLLIENTAKKTAVDPLVLKPVKLKGPVRGVDFNPVDQKLLATGSADGEILVWDLSNLSAKPYAPGPRSPRLDDITALAWNRLYNYILATASNNGCTAIWDLRSKNEIASFSHPGGRRLISSVAWNPDSPTQIATASDDDAYPGILIWDLRNSRAPEKVLQSHSKGVLNISWCPKDSELLLSCGKDNRTIVWNPQGSGGVGSVVGDLHHSNNWTFDAQWCPRNPDLIAVASFDGKVAIHSLQATSSDLEATHAEANTQPLSARDKTHSNDPFSQLQHQSHHQHAAQSSHTFTLPYPPKWLKRPAGHAWGFGNRLVYFGKKAGAPAIVSIQKVVSEHAFVARAAELERVAGGGNVQELISYCQTMSAPILGTDLSSTALSGLSEKDRELWKFLGVMFETGSRQQVVQFLGFDTAEVAETEKLVDLLKKLLISTEPLSAATTTADHTAKENGVLEHHTNGEGLNGVPAAETEVGDFDLIAAQNSKAELAAAPSKATATPFKLYSSMPGESSDTDALIMKSLVLGNFETIVRLCFGANRLADALAFAACGGQELLQYAKAEYFKRLKGEKSYIRVLSNVVGGDLHDIVENANIDGNEGEWKDLMAIICMYAQNEDIASLFATLGRRLEKIAITPVPTANLKTVDWKAKEEKKFAAILCYLVAGDLSKVLPLWASRESEEEKLLKTNKNAKSLLTSKYSSHALALQSLIEKVQVFRQAIEFVDNELTSSDSAPFSLESLYQRYIDYAQVATSQGLVSVAWRVLQLVPDSFHPAKIDPIVVAALKDRIYNSGLVKEAASCAQPAFPFDYNDITQPPAPPPQPVAAAPTAYANSYGSNAYSNQGNLYGTKPQPSPSYGQNQYGQSNLSYGSQSGYSGSYGQNQNATSGFVLPPPPSVGQNLSNAYGGNYAAQPPPPISTGYTPSNPYNSQQIAPPPVAGFSLPPPSAAKSVSQSGQYSAPQPQPMGNAGQPFTNYGGVVPPPPSTSVPPQRVAPPPQAATPSGPTRHPSGDRSHIKPMHLPIVAGLDTLMVTVKATKITPQQKREWEDTEKKLMNLFDQLNNSEVAEDIVAKLLAIVKALQAGEYSSAHKLQVDLMTQKFTVTSSWIVGVKRIIDSLERSHLDKIQNIQHASPTAASPGYPAANVSGAYSRPPPPPAATGPRPPTQSSAFGAQQPPPVSTGHSYQSNSSVISPSQPSYGSATLPPPAPANQQPYRGPVAAQPPPPANQQPYAGTNQLPPPPVATNNSYGGGQSFNRPNSLPPPPAANQHINNPRPPSNSFGGNPLPKQQYPPSTSGSFNSTGNVRPPPTVQQQQYGSALNLPPPPPASANPYVGNMNAPGYPRY